MPKIYKRSCDYCGKYYESPASRFCCLECPANFRRGENRLRIEATKEQLEKLYKEEQLSTETVAKFLGIGKSTVCRKLKSFNIPIRDYNEAGRICGKRQRRQNHPCWKGGRRYRVNGYNAILKPEHPRAHKDGYVQEHILIWEQANKKDLPEGWVIHHINGIKNDNRLDNLLAMPKGKHSSTLVIQVLQERIRELEGVVKDTIQG